MAANMTRDEANNAFEQNVDSHNSKMLLIKNQIDKELVAAIKVFNNELKITQKTEAEIAELTAKKYQEMKAAADLQKQNADNELRSYEQTHSTLLELKQMSAARIDALKAKQQELDIEITLSDTANSKVRAMKESAELAKTLADEEARQARFAQAIADAEKDGATYSQKKASAAEKLAAANKLIQAKKKERDKKLAGAKTDEEKEGIMTLFNSEMGSIAEGLGMGDIGSQIVGALAGPWGAALQIFEGISAMTSKIQEKLDGSVDEAMGVISKYMGPMDARLQSLDTNAINFSNIQDDINHKIGVSPYVSQKSLFETVSDLVSKGIAYNVEQRAFIQELSDRMVTTFDALDASLTRLIRLQQADLTMSQMGSEAQLTKFLNYMFQDTSYLNSLYDTINGAIIDASAQLDVDQATQYSYAVQKWLSSLYSVGMDEGTIQNVARGITALSTGNVNELNNNEALRILLGQSASRGGMSIDTFLTNGMTASQVNELMKSMVEYLQDIANNTSNNVTRAAYANMLNVTLSDLVAAGNLTTNDINAIYNSNINYQTAMNETANQLSLVTDRTTLAQKVDTVIDNLFFDFGMQVAENDWMYGIWKANSVISDIQQDFLGDAADKGVVKTIMKVLSGITTMATFAVEVAAFVQTVADAFTSIANKGGLGGFEWSAYTSRGDGLAAFINDVTAGSSLPLTGLVSTGISYSGAATSNMSSADAAIVTLAENAEKATYTAQTVVDATSTIMRDASDIYAELFELQTTPIRVKLASVEDGVYEQLQISNLINKISSIESTVTNKVNVDVVNDDISTIINHVYNVRGSLV